MILEVKIPDEVFKDDNPSISRDVLEAIAVEGFRTDQLSTAQVRRLLGFKTRDEVHEFLYKHGVPWVDYDAGEVEREVKLLQELLP